MIISPSLFPRGVRGASPISGCKICRAFTPLRVGNLRLMTLRLRLRGADSALNLTRYEFYY